MTTRLKRILFLCLTVSLLVGAGSAVGPMRQMRSAYDLTNEPEEGLSPEIALWTQVLGWGRGLIIDVIWIRMETLKQNNKYFELVQLADWATKLAPRFPQVWDIQSWNLAYNVSCKVMSLPDRWAWVYEGIKLLRDEGIPYNPHSSMLYDRLAWIFMHKIGDQSDNAHFFHKAQFGLMMHEVLGGDGSYERLRGLASTPNDVEEILADPDVKPVYDACMAHEFDIVEGFFDVYRRTPSVPLPVLEIANQPGYEKGVRKIAAFARAKRLREEFKMDPARMIAICNEFADDKGVPAPFDWRSPYPHAIYWAEAGLDKLKELKRRTETKLEARGRSADGLTKTGPTGEEEGVYEFRQVMLERIRYAAMQSLSRQGRLLFDTYGRLMYEVGADLRFADATLPLFDEVVEAHGVRYKMGAEEALRNFLTRGTMEFWFMGDKERSAKYFRMLHDRFPEYINEPTFEDYLSRQFREKRVDMTFQEARRWISAQIRIAFYSLGCNAYDKSNYYLGQAKAFAKFWNEEEAPDETMRSKVSYERLYETVLQDIVTGVTKFEPAVRSNLMRQLEDDEKGKEVLARIRETMAATGKSLPDVEQVEEKWRVYHY